MAVRVTQIRSQIGTKQDHRGTLKALGLGRINSSRVHKDTPALRGMLHKIDYLLRVEENVTVEEKPAKAAPKAAAKKAPAAKPKATAEKAPKEES